MLNKEVKKKLSKLISESSKNDLSENNLNYLKKVDILIDKIVKS